MSPERPARRRAAHLWARLGLRARVTFMFGMGALLLSVSVGSICYLVARHVLASERESASLHQAYLNATAVRRTLSSVDPANIEAVLSAADSGNGSHSLIKRKHTWYERTALFGPDAIPSGVRRLVAEGTVATQTYDRGGTPEIAVGVPLPSVKVEYFVIFDVSDLGHTLRVLLLTLFGAGLATTVLGAVVGRWASGGSLRPLNGVSRAAVAIAGGELGTRLTAAPGDPDLEGLTTSFNRMVDQLQERIEREARFTSDVSHELRSPLTTMGASLEVLERGADQLAPSARRALELLSADLRRFQRMVGELLEISRSDAGSADVWREEVDPGELARRAVAAATRTLPPGTPTPAVEVSPSLAGIRLSVDKRRFERVMTNLLENAALYGGGATTVRVEPGRVRPAAATPKIGRVGRSHRTGAPGVPGEPTSVVFSVEDHGPGLPPSERARVFERFYRGHSSGQRGSGNGSGLGLALVAEHVRLHGGRVWVDEADGGGARFSVELPSNPPEPHMTDEVFVDEPAAEVER